MRSPKLVALLGIALTAALLFPQVSLAQYMINTIAGGGPNNLPALQSGLGYTSGIARDSGGNTYIADAYSSQILRISSSGTVTVAAGNGTNGYLGDGGSATSAALNRPESVAVDGSGNVYIADTGNSVIRVVNTGTQSETIAGVTIAAGNIQTVAGNGTAGYGGDGGAATGAELNAPYGLFVDAQGNIFIADTDNSIVREVSASGLISTIAGTPGTTGFSGDGSAATGATLDLPQGVFVDASGNIYIADTYNSVIRAVNPSSQAVTIVNISIAAGAIQTIAGTYYSGGLGVACQSSGDNGPATSAFLCLPEGVYADASGDVYIADSSNAAVREVVSSATISTIAGTLGTAGYSGDGGAATSAELNYPASIVLDGSGNLLIADTDNYVIREVSAGNISTFAGNGTEAYSGNGVPAANAALNIPGGAFADGSGNLYFADTYSSVIREIVAATGNIQTLAGDGLPCAIPSTGCGDAGLATAAQLNFPQGIFVDGAGNVFIADTESSVIREVVASTGIIQTIAGTPGTAGYSGDGAAATSAQLSKAAGVLVDGSGNVYIADTGNSAIRVVNMGVSPITIAGITIQAGSIATIAGNGTSCSDGSSGCGDGGQATAAQLNFPGAISLDANGNIYIADTFSNAVREVNAGTGVIQTVAGTLGQRGYAGDNGPATSASLDTPYSLFVDFYGNIFIADSDNSVIREVVAVNNNTIQTIAGNTTPGFTGDGSAANAAEINSPFGVTGNIAGTVFIADTENSRIRQLTSTVDVNIVPGSATVPLGDTQQFAASVTGTSNTDVTWQVNHMTGGNGTVGKISAAGLYQAPATQPALGISVIAISNSNGATSASLALTLAGSGTPAISVTSTPSGVTNIYTGSTQQFNATVVNESNTAVNWQINNVAGGNATLGNINNSGLYTAPGTIASPTLVVITAVSQASSSVSGSYPVTIFTAPSASEPASQAISPGSSANYSLALNANTGNPRQAITLSCLQSSLPPGATCTFTPTTITPSSTAVPFTMSVNVPAGSAALMGNRGTWLAMDIFAAFPLAGLVLLGGKTRRFGWMLVIAALAFVLALTACGGSNSTTNGQTSKNPEVGSYSIQILGTTAAQPNPVQITTAGLTVQ